MHAEAMLLVDHGQGEIAERDLLLEQRVRADGERDLARLQAGQNRRARGRLVAPGQQRELHAGRLGQRLDGGEMLARQDLRRRQQRGLAAGLGRRQHGQQRHHRLAAADVALQQPEHARLRRHVGLDLGQRARLRGREGEGQGGDRLALQAAAADDPPARLPALAGAHEGERQLVGQQLVERQPLARRRIQRQVALALRLMHGMQGGAPGRPALPLQIGRVLPFRQFGRAGERLADRLAQHLRRQSGGQAIDRLDLLEGRQFRQRHDVVRMGHLQLGPVPLVALDAAADGARLADRQRLQEIVGAGIEEDEMDEAGLVAAAHLVGQARIGGRDVAVDRSA